MKIKKKCVAMLLAGGQGSRLYALTQKVAKPAIPTAVRIASSTSRFPTASTPASIQSAF